MARVLNEKEFAARRNEILDVAQQLIYTRGCDQMSIQDILDALKISKGAFYHYFASKPDLLEALVERMTNEVLAVVDPIAADPQLNALEKLQRYFNTAARWKTTHKALLLGLLRSWYADDNLILRQKVTRRGFERIQPLVTQMIGQGVDEGVFTTPYPQHAAGLIIALMITLGDNITQLILGASSGQDGAGPDALVQEIETLVGAYSDAFERILGSQPGSLKIVEIDLLKEWLISPDGDPSKGA